MRSSVTPTQQRFSTIFAGLALTAGIAALLDGLDAVVYYRLATETTATLLFQFIAGAAVLGRSTFSMGAASVLLGVAIHCLIAATATAVFYLLATQMRFLVRKPWVWGPIFGFGLYLVMHYLVVPHGRLPRTSHAAFWRSELADQLFSHTIFVGLTITLGVRRVLRGQDHR